MTNIDGKDRILIVDDIPSNISVLVEILADGYDVFAVTNGADALQAVVDVSPHLILLDIVMPGMDGYEVCRRLQASDTTRSIAIIFITATNDTNGEVYGLSLGAVDFITRPLNPPVVLARVKTHLEFRRSREKALEASRAKSAFLATMSHELRTPLNSIIGFADLLSNSSLNDEQQKFVSVILHSSRNLLAIISDVLDFSKIEAGKLVLESRLFNLQDLFDNIVDFFAVSMRGKGLNFSYLLSPTTPCLLLGDGHRLRQILLNLLGNALKFTQRGRVGLTVEPHMVEGRKVELRFTVKDTGIGIPAKAREYLFQAFSQVDSSDTRKYGGTGLGLVISSRLVSMMGGELQVESTEHVGSSFSFIAQFQQPLLDDVLNLPLPRYLGSTDERAREGKLLVVDNDENSRFLVKTLLNNWGFINVYAVESGETCLDELHKNKFDIIFMDVQMSGMDGMETTRMIRQQEARSKERDHLVIIAVTADVTFETRQNCHKVGMDDFLAKPFQPNELMRIVRRFLYDHPGMDTNQVTPLSISCHLFPARGESIYLDTMAASAPVSHQDWLAKIVEYINIINNSVLKDDINPILQAAKNLMDIGTLLKNNRLYQKGLQVLTAARGKNHDQIKQAGGELSLEYMTGNLFSQEGP